MVIARGLSNLADVPVVEFVAPVDPAEPAKVVTTPEDISILRLM